MTSRCRSGTTVYTGLLNARGTYESDLTVARLAADRFLLVTGTAQATRDADWISRNLADGAARTLTDVTSAYAVIAVMGPRARDLLAQRHQSAARQCGVSVRRDPRDRHRRTRRCCASRRTYVGELGWELYVPAELRGAASMTR